MEYLQLTIPPFPYFVIGGSALYRSGDLHLKRSDLGMFNLLFVEYGELHITQNAQEYTLRDGDILILDPKGNHFGHKPTEVETMFYWTHFVSPNEHSYTTTLSFERNQDYNSTQVYNTSVIIPVHKHLSDDNYRKMLSYLKRVESVTINRFTDVETIAKQDISHTLYHQELFIAVLRLLQVSPANKYNTNKIAVNAMHYLYNNYHLPLTLEHISSHFHLHPAHLIRCVKNEYGETPIEALNRIRIDHAKVMLLESGMTISDVCKEVGYSSASYFGKVFKKYTGMSPKVFAQTEML